MKTLVTERGERPRMQTKARVIAPQAAKYLADVFEPKTFADSVVIVVDWVGDMTWDEPTPMPEELKLPVMVVITEKRYPQFGNRQLRVNYVLDLEDFFGQDNATKDDLHLLAQLMEEKVREEEQKKGISI
jgi:hypothetical protein